MLKNRATTKYGRFFCWFEARFLLVVKKIRRSQTGTLSTVYSLRITQKRTGRPAPARATPALFSVGLSTPRRLTCRLPPSADEDDDVDVQLPAGRRFRRSVVRPAFGQASSAPPRVARRCTATARARPSSARGCSSPATAVGRRVSRVPRRWRVSRPSARRVLVGGWPQRARCVGRWRKRTQRDGASWPKDLRLS
jgi:hypothetical protein